MANRGDYNSVLPRALKRQLSLTSTGDPHRDGEIRRIMIGAHAHARKVRNQSQKSGFGGTDDEPTANVTTTTASV